MREGDRDEDALNKVAQRAAGRLLGQKYRRQPVLLAGRRRPLSRPFRVRRDRRCATDAPERLHADLLVVEAAIEQAPCARAFMTWNSPKR